MNETVAQLMSLAIEGVKTKHDLETAALKQTIAELEQKVTTQLEDFKATIDQLKSDFVAPKTKPNEPVKAYGEGRPNLSQQAITDSFKPIKDRLAKVGHPFDAYAKTIEVFNNACKTFKVSNNRTLKPHQIRPYLVRVEELVVELENVEKQSA